MPKIQVFSNITDHIFVTVELISYSLKFKNKKIQCLILLFFSQIFFSCKHDDIAETIIADQLPIAEPAPINPSVPTPPDAIPLPISPSPFIPTQMIQKNILVDQFGYRPNDKKVVVIKNPQLGFDANQKFIPGLIYEVRNINGNQLTYSTTPMAWNNGATQVSSGDKGWWVDISSVTTEGSYYLLDVTNNVRSPIFKISQNVYNDILKTVIKTFYYQRSGTAKLATHAGTCWEDSISYFRPNQDSNAESLLRYQSPNIYPSKKIDLSGGWFDAGDTNKYTTFAVEPISQLLMAYDEKPQIFTDNYNIPESGNGIPDILDEVKWELDWLKKMQDANTDGSLALKIGQLSSSSTNAAPPSIDTNAKYYIPTCTSSTITGAIAFAQGSYVFSKIPSLQGESVVLLSRALNAWNNFLPRFNANSLEINCDDQTIAAGDADLTIKEQRSAAVVAAIFLYATTGNSEFHNFIINNISSAYPMHPDQRVWDWGLYGTYHSEALLFYTRLNNANETIKNNIRNQKLALINKTSVSTYQSQPADDLYRSFMPNDQYHWGSNRIRTRIGNDNMDAVKNSILISQNQNFQDRALSVLHYLHGVNPFGWTYLSNMTHLGASHSISKIYHAWFETQTKWDSSVTSQCGPAPGYLAGGPNKNTNACSSGGRYWNNSSNNYGDCANGSSLATQPIQKAYAEINYHYLSLTGQSYFGYELTEPAIYYQSNYVKLLSNFVD